jgi:glutathione synthase
MKKIAFQIDELYKLKYHTDSSYMIMQEAFARGCEVFFYYPKSLSWVKNKVFANVFKVTDVLDYKQMQSGVPIIYEEVGAFDLSNTDIIFLRQDPPFDMAYITSTFLLEKLMPKVKIVNNPVSVRNSPEKLLVTDFAELMPKTLISSDFNTIWNFLEQNKKCVIKPLYGNAGSDVFYLELTDFNAKAIIEYFLHTFKEQVMVQEFLPNVKNGDKRIILIDGEPMGFFHRIPAKNQIKSNLAAGGTAQFSPLNAKEVEICNTIAPTLKKLGLFFVGIDVIDGFLTEINVTSPTGIRIHENMTGENLARVMLDKLM